MIDERHKEILARAEKHKQARYQHEQECAKLTQENHELKAEVERLHAIITNKAEELKEEGRYVESETLLMTERIGKKNQKEAGDE